MIRGTENAFIPFTRLTEVILLVASMEMWCFIKTSTETVIKLILAYFPKLKKEREREMKIWFLSDKGLYMYREDSMFTSPTNERRWVSLPDLTLPLPRPPRLVSEPGVEDP